MHRLQSLLLVFGLIGSSVVGPRWARASPPLVELQVVPLPGVERRIDHFAVDPAGKRLFVAALGNGTLEVVDLAAGKRIRSIPGLREPQGVAYLPTFHRIVVAARGGTVEAFDDRDYRPATPMLDMSEPDNLRFDAAASQLYVGYGDGALAVIEPASMKRIAEIPLPGHPESFRLEESGPHVFVNVPRTREILIVDRGQRSIVTHIPLGSLANNYPMSLDEAGHRLFVGVRQPARMLVLDTVSSKAVAAVPCAGDTDDLFYDARRDRVYVVGGEGFVDVFDTSRQASTLAWRVWLRASERVRASGRASLTGSSWPGRCETLTQRRSTCWVPLLANSERTSRGSTCRVRAAT
jgi:YVTN family beta-propeller protein